jgi:DNA repair protein RadA/Sms
MARKASNHFFCASCGHEAARWFGRCPACGTWNTASEAPASGAPGKAKSGRRTGWVAGAAAAAVPRALADVETASFERAPSGLGEVDRVLGGGIVPGSLILVGGDPGIGKSTLMLQVAFALAAAGTPVLMVAGEESEQQIKLRAGRLGAVPPGLMILCETDLDAALEAAAAQPPGVLIADSIQTLSRTEVEGGPGSVSQVRECGLTLLRYAKTTGTTVFLIGHVTKDGAVAGPRVLEHMVDAVLYLEGERYQHYRVLRAAKNRFGSTNELGVFEMTDAGLREIANPSLAFLSESARREPGSAVVASLEGSRPLLVEVQALVSTSFYATPQRVTNGFDPRRLAVLLAVLERRVGLRLGRHDVFVTVTGGIRLDEPGSDLGVAMAAASSFRARPVLEGTLLVGEVSLSGELRRVARLEARVREAAQIGFARAGVPAAQADEARGLGLEIVPVATLREAIELLLGERVTSTREDGDEPADAAHGREAAPGAASANPPGAARGREPGSGEARRAERIRT